MLASLTPGLIDSYDKDRRLCRVEIPGITKGGDALPEAEFCYPVGDKSEHTEIRIIKGDRVWLAFIDGDPRHPVIMGFRPKNTGNGSGTRRFHHENIELVADGNILIQAGGTVTIKAAKKVINDTPDTEATGNTSVQMHLSFAQGLSGKGGGNAAAVAIEGDVKVTGGDVEVDGIGSKAHHHDEHDGPPTGSAKR